MRSHPAADLFPLLDVEQLAALAEDIREQGQREPIVLLDGEVLDGRNRLRACKVAKVEPRTREATAREREHPTAFVISTNLRRRHLDPGQRAYVSASARPLFEAEAKARQKAAGGDKKSEKAKKIAWDRSGTKRSREPKATEQAAKATGAGRNSTAAVAKLIAKAPAVAALVRDGLATVADAVRIGKSPDRDTLVAAVRSGVAPATALRASARAQRVARIVEISEGNGELSDGAGVYPVIYADPPWRYEHAVSDSRAIENQYPTMSLDEICALKVPTTDDAILFLWATSPKLAEAMRVVADWGFTYRTCMVWDKLKIGNGYYARQQHELLLIATRGEPPTPAPGDRPSSVVSIKRGEHSVKPDRFYEIIEAMYPDYAKIELFARAARKGWARWGNQS